VKYLFITDDPAMAAYVDACGVDRLFVDLETLGKQERQRRFDTVISRHDARNIGPVKAAARRAEVMVRLNPLHAGSDREVDAAVEAGADSLMLPMFRTAEEVAGFCRLVRGRVPVIPLVETADALRSLRDAIAVEGVTEIHVGLNDLHRDLGLRFLFEPLASGLVEAATEHCRRRDFPFGVGGISRVGHGEIPGELVLAEHCRIGSSRAILSRAFHERAKNLDELRAKIDLPTEIGKLRVAEWKLLRRTPEEIEHDKQRFRHAVLNVVRKAA
jgi:hypothetical protein